MRTKHKIRLVYAGAVVIGVVVGYCIPYMYNNDSEVLPNDDRPTVANFYKLLKESVNQMQRMTAIEQEQLGR